MGLVIKSVPNTLYYFRMPEEAINLVIIFTQKQEISQIISVESTNYGTLFNLTHYF